MFIMCSIVDTWMCGCGRLGLGREDPGHPACFGTGQRASRPTRVLRGSPHYQYAASRVGCPFSWHTAASSSAPKGPKAKSARNLATALNSRADGGPDALIGGAPLVQLVGQPAELLDGTVRDIPRGCPLKRAEGILLDQCTAGMRQGHLTRPMYCMVARAGRTRHPVLAALFLGTPP